jgi:hypothetical protein
MEDTMKKLLVLTAVLASPLLFAVATQLPTVGVLLLSTIGNNLDPFLVIALSVLMILAVLGFGDLLLAEPFGVIFILGALL